MLDHECLVLQRMGRLRGKGPGELRTASPAQAGDGDLALDMREVKLGDQEVVSFLACCKTGGTELRNWPAYIEEWNAREREGNGEHSKQ